MGDGLVVVGELGETSDDKGELRRVLDKDGLEGSRGTYVFRVGGL